MKRLFILLLTVCLATALSACAESTTSASSDTTTSSESDEIQQEHISFEPQFNQSVMCSNLPIGDEKPKNLDILVTAATIVDDIHSLATENFTDSITNQISGWNSLPSSLLGLEDDTRISLLCVNQTITNNSGEEVEFYVNSNRVIALDNSSGNELSDDGYLYANPIYIDANGKNDLTEVDDGVRRSMFKITLAAGETTDVTVGYAVSDELLEYPLMYVINPFGREDSSAGRLVLGYVE